MDFAQLAVQSILANPWCWPFALLVPLYLVLALLRNLPWPRPHGDDLRYLLRAQAVLALAAFVAAATAYLVSAGFFDHIEPNITCVAWYFWTGKDVYHAPGSVERYNLPYGPALYIVLGTAQGLLGPSVFATKLPGYLAALAAVGLTFAAIRRQTGAWTALIAVGLLAALLLKHFHFAFLPRADPFLLLLTAAGLYLVVGRAQAAWAPALLGAALGAAVNLKFHALLYFFPLLMIAWQQGWRGARFGIVGAVAAAVFGLPFLVLGNVALANYLGILSVTARHGFDPTGFTEVFGWAVVTVVPIGLLVGYGWLRDPEQVRAALLAGRPLLLTLLGSFLLMLLPASKYGAGSYHLSPFLPSLLYAGALLARGLDLRWQPTRPALLLAAAGGSWLLCCVGNALTNSWQIARTAQASSAPSAAVIADLDRIAAENGGDALVLAGVGEASERDYPLLYQRHALVFRGMPIGLDPAGVMEYKLGTGATPDLGRFLEGVGAMDGRRVLWVIPKGVKPFSMPTLYPPRDVIFSAAFQAEFARRFELGQTTEWFDVYREKPAAAAPRP